MNAFSVSFTLGKASSPHGANLDHNNRLFHAPNINPTRTEQNVTYIRQDVEDAYHELFDQAVAAYNAKQYRKDRIIHDYFEHIDAGCREESFYEVVVQFGDMQTAPCGSERGKVAAQLLDEYVKEFQQRNPNLHVFNAVLHLDEASPHLHINFIPFYTKGRKNGLQKGVSMKQALIEQGFQPKSSHDNQLVMWERSEQDAMEKLLLRHGLDREDKNVHRAHMTVSDYKAFAREPNLRLALQAALSITDDMLKEESVRSCRCIAANLRSPSHGRTMPSWM